MVLLLLGLLLGANVVIITIEAYKAIKSNRQ